MVIVDQKQNRPVGLDGGDAKRWTLMDLMHLNGMLMNAVEKVKRITKFVALYQVGQWGIDEVLCLGALRQALDHAKRLGKPVLNISCGSTAYGHVNADIFPQNVPNFVRYEPNEPLPFPDKMFGAVYSAHTIEHTKDPAFFMAELRRVADKVFCVYPLISSLDAYAPYHRWLGIGLHGEKWLQNPLFSDKITGFVEKVNRYPIKFLPMTLFKFSIEPNYLQNTTFDEHGQLTQSTNYHFVSLYDVKRERLLFTVAYDLVKKEKDRALGLLMLAQQEILRVAELEPNAELKVSTGKMLVFPQIKQYQIHFRDELRYLREKCWCFPKSNNTRSIFAMRRGRRWGLPGFLPSGSGIGGSKEYTWRSLACCPSR